MGKATALPGIPGEYKYFRMYSNDDERTRFFDRSLRDDRAFDGQRTPRPEPEVRDPCLRRAHRKDRKGPRDPRDPDGRGPRPQRGEGGVARAAARGSGSPRREL